MREVLGGGSGGRYYADGEDTIHVVPDSRNLPTEFTEARFPFRVEALSLAIDSGGAGPFRGGLGYEKHIRMLKDAHFMSIADRSILSCWGVNGREGRATLPGDDRPRRPGRARGRRAGRRRARARRRGDPHPDHRWRRLGRPARARPGPGRARRASGGRSRPRPRCADYGVVLTGSPESTTSAYDAAATATERAGRSRGRPRRSSTAARATPAWPAARRTPTWTSWTDRSDGRDAGTPRYPASRAGVPHSIEHPRSQRRGLLVTYRAASCVMGA